MIFTTLIYLKNEDDYLFLERNKKKNDLNAGKFIGVGGHIEKGENAIECLKREVFEETGVSLKTYDYIGKIFFNNTKYEKETIFLFVGELEHLRVKDCDEGTFTWVNKDKIMDLNLWEGDKLFLPYLYNKKKDKSIILRVNYDGDLLLNSSLTFYDDNRQSLIDITTKFATN